MITGFAIVSAQGYIADVSGEMSSIEDDEDFRRLQRCLSVPNTIGIMGRVTHEKHVNERARMRWILSSRKHQTGLKTETFFDNAESLLGATLNVSSQSFYVLGGGTIYPLFGRRRFYDVFNLTVNKKSILGNGLPLDPELKGNLDGIERAWGLMLNHREIDHERGLEFRRYIRSKDLNP